MNGNARGKTTPPASCSRLFRRSKCAFGFTRKRHLERDEEKQQAAKNLNESMEMPMADKNPAPTNAKSSSIPLATNTDFRAILCLYVARAFGESGKHRDQRDRFDHDEEHDEKLQGLFEQVLCARYSFL
jgi:hypothetical protein